MQNEWILDVLADLKAFARQNGMGALAEQLDDTRLVAATELALTTKGQAGNERRTAITAGPNSGGPGRRY